MTRSDMIFYGILLTVVAIFVHPLAALALGGIAAASIITYRITRGRR